jgi:hypothetical protein
MGMWEWMEMGECFSSISPFCTRRPVIIFFLIVYGDGFYDLRAIAVKIKKLIAGMNRQRTETRAARRQDPH